MGVGKVHGEMEGRAIKWALEVSVYQCGIIHDNPGSGTHPNKSTDAWTKKYGPRTVESQDLVSPRALSTNPKLTKAEEKQLTTEDE